MIQDAIDDLELVSLSVVEAVGWLAVGWLTVLWLAVGWLAVGVALNPEILNPGVDQYPSEFPALDPLDLNEACL